MRHVTVPGAGDGSHEPVLAYIEGGWGALSHRLAGAIREQLYKLGFDANGNPTQVHGMQDPTGLTSTRE